MRPTPGMRANGYTRAYLPVESFAKANTESTKNERDASRYVQLVLLPFCFFSALLFPSVTLVRLEYV